MLEIFKEINFKAALFISTLISKYLLRGGIMMLPKVSKDFIMKANLNFYNLLQSAVEHKSQYIVHCRLLLVQIY